MAEKKVEKQRYTLGTIEEFLTKIDNKDSKGVPLDSKTKLNLALNVMLKGKKIVGTTIRKGLNYFILEAE